MELKFFFLSKRHHSKDSLVNINTVFKTSVDSQNRDFMNLNAAEHRVPNSAKWNLDILDNKGLELIIETTAFGLSRRCLCKFSFVNH